MQRLRRGEIVVDRLSVDGTQTVPDALLHHWIGTVFVQGARVKDAVALMQDYDSSCRNVWTERDPVQAPRTSRRHVQSISSFLYEEVVSVTLNTEHEAQFTSPATDRTYSVIRSTRVAEVDDAGTPSEREERPGTGHGFMWRLNTYWRFLEQEGAPTCNANPSRSRATSRSALDG